ncbi:hypothetical protein SAMN04488696_0385 [Methanolobus profundi]|uniref:Uncharacterized protein n=1 Tax=Methanolobus profundi TaxID=487685 RepID=A0A1I4P0W5_9EURY|nr:hypothetical protein SAMN04488696_0385 [Methanolobus profundi]
MDDRKVIVYEISNVIDVFFPEINSQLPPIKMGGFLLQSDKGEILYSSVESFTVDKSADSSIEIESLCSS